MAVFPLFTDLTGKRCILVGGGKVAARKAEILTRFEANLIVIAPKIVGSLKQLEEKGKIKVIRKAYSEKDLEGAFLVVAATSSQEVNNQVFLDAKAGNIPVNTVDDPNKCTFIFPSVIKRGNFVIGISTSGEYPALSKRVRRNLEELYTVEYAEILEMLSSFRSKVRSSLLSSEQQAEILKQVVEDFFNESDRTRIVLGRILDSYGMVFGEEGNGIL